MNPTCDLIAERVALGASLGELAEHAAGCARCQRLIDLPTKLGATHHDVDPGLGFAARMTMGAQHRLTARRRQRVVIGLATTVAVGALAVFFVTRSSDETTAPVIADVTPVIDVAHDVDVKSLVHLANVDRSRRLAADWPDIEESVAPYRRVLGGPVAPVPPTPPVTKVPPVAPVPPVPAKGGKGVSVTINNGKVQIDGIKDLVSGELDRARATIKNNPSIPKAVRDKQLERLDKVRATLDKRLGNLKITDLDQLGHEMDKMGEELELALGDDDDDVDDADDDDAIPMAPEVDIDVDDSDLADALTDLKDLALKPAQRDQITKLRTESDKSASSAKKQLDDLSAKLRAALANSASTDAEVTRLIDQVSAQEAAIRKARILAWVQARRVLDEAQRKKIQDAATKKTK